MCARSGVAFPDECKLVLAQLVYMFVGFDTSMSGMWLLEASDLCILAVVGVTALKMLIDLASLVPAVRRQWRWRLLLRVRVRAPSPEMLRECDHVMLNGLALPAVTSADIDMET